MDKVGYVYMLSNNMDSTLYIGVTSNLAERIMQHKLASGSKFARGYHLTKLVWYEKHDTITSAIKREKRLKKWDRAWKDALINAVNPQWQELEFDG